MTKTIKLTLLFFTCLVITSAATALAYADCYRECMDAHGCGSSMDSSYCSGTQARCSTDCRDKGPGGRGKIYGAIAYSAKNGVYGYSHGWTNKKKAEKVAVKNCSANGKGCKSRVWFYNSCGAVAADGSKVTWAQGSSEQEARKKALDKCKRNFFRRHCEVKVSHCAG